MGFLDKLFGTNDSVDQQLKTIYVPLFESMGMNPSQAKDQFHEVLQSIKQEAKKEGTDQWPNNMGDVFLANLSNYPKMEHYLQIVRTDGVTDDDFRQWWNRHDLERRIILKTDEMFRMSTFISRLQDGYTPDEAGADVRKWHAIYGDPNNVTKAQGDDRPLPHELKNRINIYLENLMKRGDPEAQKEKVGSYSSFNAFIRSEVRDGRI